MANLKIDLFLSFQIKTYSVIGKWMISFCFHVINHLLYVLIVIKFEDKRSCEQAYFKVCWKFWSIFLPYNYSFIFVAVNYFVLLHAHYCCRFIYLFLLSLVGLIDTKVMIICLLFQMLTYLLHFLCDLTFQFLFEF